MVKSIDDKNRTEKDENLKKNPCKGKDSCTKDHNETYKKKHEKDHFPRKVWPTDSEKKGHKGPKI